MTVAYIPSVRALPGQAPTALDLECLASNLEWVNSNRFPQYALMTLSANKNVTLSTATGFGTLSFDVATSNNYGLVSGGILTIPTGTKFIKRIVQIATAFTNKEIAVYSGSSPVLNSGVVYTSRAFSIGYGSTADGFGSGQTCSAFEAWDGLNATNRQNVSIGGLPSGTTFTILQNYSWLYLEIFK